MQKYTIALFLGSASAMTVNFDLIGDDASLIQVAASSAAKA